MWKFYTFQDFSIQGPGRLRVSQDFVPSVFMTIDVSNWKKKKKLPLYILVCYTFFNVCFNVKKNLGSTGEFFLAHPIIIYFQIYALV